MGKAPAFQLYASDFYMDTNDWEPEEVGVYIRLLLSEWVNGGLPIEHKKLARIAGCEENEFEKWWPQVSEKFHENGNGKLLNNRMEKVRKEQKKYIKLQSEKGKASWSPSKVPRYPRESLTVEQQRTGIRTVPDIWICRARGSEDRFPESTGCFSKLSARTKASMRWWR